LCIWPVIATVAGMMYLSKRPELIRGESGRRNIIAFVTGAVLWAVSFALMAQGYGAGSEGIRATGVAVGVMLLVAVWLMSAIGWDLMPGGGAGGLLVKAIATVIIGGTVVGFVLLFYWTGICALRIYEKTRQQPT
jgi:hypothetical protein